MSISVVGFDVGNSTSYVAVAKGGGIETIANEYSDRCTPTYVSFGEKKRFMGASSKQQATTNIKNTIFNFTRLLGKKFSDPSVQKELPLLPFKVFKLEGDKIGIECQYLNETVTFTPEQIMAVQLTKLKEITETHLNAPCIDVVINVPCYYTDAERRSMLDAAQISGLNCVRLVNDTTACGIAYGLYNKDLPSPDNAPRIVAFVMLGHSNLQVAICAFNNGKMKVLSTSCDPNLGGRDFDFAIYQNFCDDIKARYKLDVPSRPKAVVRLLQECEKLKKLMSANSTKLPLNIECFMEDKDISCAMQRTEFEELIGGQLSRIEKTLEDCLLKAKLTAKDVHSVELVGGSTRVPAVKALVSKVFHQEGRTSLNSDEAVARGCALQAAICSPAFRVRDFAVSDLTPYAVKLSVLGGSEPYNVEIFPQMHHVPSSRQVDIKRGSDFEVEAYYSDPAQLPNANAYIGKYLVRNVKKIEGADAKIQVKVRMNRHGVFNLSGAQMAEPYQKEVEEDMTPEEMKAAGVSPTTPMEVDAKTEENGEENTTDEAAAKEKPAEAPKPKIPKKKVIKTFIRWIDLPVDVVSLPQLTPTEQNHLKERECEMIQADHLESERSNAKNALEEYIYEMRDKLSGPLEPFILESDREQFSAQLSKLEDWLYDEGEDLQKQPYIDKLQSLKSVGDVYTMRYREAEIRPAAFERLAKVLNSIEKTIQSYAAGEETFNHLTAQEIGEVRKAVDEKRAWYDSKCNAQNSRKPHEDPVVYSAEIEQQTQNLISTTNPILTKKKPEVKAPPPPSPAAEGAEATNGHPNEKEQPQNGSKPSTNAAGENNNMPDEQPHAKAKNAAPNDVEADCMDLD